MSSGSQDWFFEDFLFFEYEYIIYQESTAQIIFAGNFFY